MLEANPVLSIVIIAKNEEKYIKFCLESLIKDTKDLGSEIILVDSRSVDRTIEIASQYPIKIAVIDKRHKTTAALGRLIGTQLAKADLIFFIDADQILMSGWLEKAMSVLRSSDLIAGVTGNMEEGVVNTDGVFSYLRKLNYFEDRYVNNIAIAKTMSGIGIFKKQILKDVAGYDPFMWAYEDQELFLRLEQAGFLVAWSSGIMSRHLEDTRRLRENLRRLYQSYYIGSGQLLRRSIQNKLFFKSIKLLIAHPIEYSIWIFLGIFCLLFSYSNYLNLFFIWCVVTIIGLVAFSIKVKDPDFFLVYLMTIFSSAIGMAIGFFILPRFKENIKWDYTVIKE